MPKKEEYAKIKADPIRYAEYKEKIKKYREEYKEKQKEYTKKWKENIYKDDDKLKEYRKKRRAQKNKYLMPN